MLFELSIGILLEFLVSYIGHCLNVASHLDLWSTVLNTPRRLVYQAARYDPRNVHYFIDIVTMSVAYSLFL